MAGNKKNEKIDTLQSEIDLARIALSDLEAALDRAEDAISPSTTGGESLVDQRQTLAYWIEGEAFRYGVESEARAALRTVARAIRRGECS